MVIFTRKDLKNIDVIESNDPELRKGFADSAKTIGRFKGNSSESAAHILHLRPLMIGTVNDSESGSFHPESPGTFDRSANCKVMGRHDPSGYAIFECEDIDNALFMLQGSYPKISDARGNVSIGYLNGKKAVDTEKSLEGGFETVLGTNQIYSIKGKDNKDHPVEEFEKLYEDYIWPTAKVNFKQTRSHYFTYFREIEAKYSLDHKGSEGTRYRHISNKIYLQLYFTKSINFIHQTKKL